MQANAFLQLFYNCVTTTFNTINRSLTFGNSIINHIIIYIYIYIYIRIYIYIYIYIYNYMIYDTISKGIYIYI